MKINLSIIVPAFNVENYIEATLFSILDQTVPVNQVIIINDGSTDKTPQIIKQFIIVHKPKNWFYYEQENKGVSNARNVGITKSDGEYILFLDGDDCIAKNLSESIQLIANENSDLIYWSFEPPEKEMVASLDVNNLNGFNIFSEMYIHRKIWLWIGAIAYKKSLLNTHNIKFTETCINGEDQELLIKVLTHTNKIIFLKNTKTFYNFRHESISNQYCVRKFDSVMAILRGTEYLEKTLNTKSNEFTKTALYFEYHLFFKKNLFLLFSKKTNPTTAIYQLLNSIQSTYDEYDLKKILKIISNDSYIKTAKNFMLKNHPKIYSYYILLKYKKIF